MNNDDSKSEQRNTEKYKTLAGSIAHEMRNALYAIRLLLPELKQNNNSKIVENLSQIINDSFNYIDVIMLMINKQKLTAKYNKKMSVAKLLENTLCTHYPRPRDKNKIIVLGDDFKIKFYGQILRFFYG